MPDLFRVPDARPDAMSVILRELRTRTGEALRDLQRALGHAVGDGIKEHAVAMRALNLRISTAGNSVMQYTHLCRSQPIGRQVVLCHLWHADRIRIETIIANGHVMLVVDPLDGTVRRRRGTDDETTPLSAGLPIHDLGIDRVDYAVICATHLRSIIYVSKPRVSS